LVLIDSKKKISDFSSYRYNQIEEDAFYGIHQKTKFIILKKRKIEYDNPSIKTISSLQIIDFLMRCGSKYKTQSMFFVLARQTDRFLHENTNYIYQNYKNVVFLLQEYFDKDQGFNGIISNLLVLIRPPFVIKAITIHKKSKKRTKAKYKLKIMYKDELIRTNNGIKQLQHHTHSCGDNKFVIRLYKTILTTFLEQKNSELYTNKTKIFKKFFKI